ncbi:MAG: hypothetical protein QNK37_02080 [Acidobacteriota bacterium]|nr:hypothetical protein [Acidobacteriota bacterium]
MNHQRYLAKIIQEQTGETKPVSSSVADTFYRSKAGLEAIREVFNHIEDAEPAEVYDCFQRFFTEDAERLLKACEQVTGFPVEEIFKERSDDG